MATSRTRDPRTARRRQRRPRSIRPLFVAAELLVALGLAVVACDVAVPTRPSAGSPAPTPLGAPTVAFGAPITASIGPTSPPEPGSLPPPTPTPLPSFFVYTVRPSDTLITIARRFATTEFSLAYWNRDRYPTLDPDSAAFDPGAIQAGWHLKLIPSASTDGEDGGPDTPSPLTASPTPGPSAP